MAGISDASTSRELEEKPSPRGDLAPLPRGPVPARERKATPARGSSTPVETLFAPAWGASTTVEIFFAHAHSKWLIFDHFHRAGAIFLSQRHPERPPGAMQGRSFFHAAPSGPQREPAALPGCGASGRRQGQAGLQGNAPATHQYTRRRRCGGRQRDLPRCRWAMAGPGRASRRRAEPKARSADGSRAGRRPPAHTAAGPAGTRNTNGATRHLGTTKPPSPTGAGRLRQSAREGQRRITTMSGSPRPLS